MKDEVPFQDFPAYTEKSTNKGKAFVIFVIIILLVAAAVGGLYFLGKNKKSETGTSVTPTEAPTSTPEPTATPTPANLDRSKLEVSVLNGSGVAGAANKIAATLKSLGYIIKATGNADKFDYTGVTINAKDKGGFADFLKKDLEEKASASAITVTVDSKLSSTSAEVIVGK